MQVTFRAKSWVHGPSTVITLPKAFIDSGMLAVGKTYTIIMKEVADNEDQARQTEEL